MKLSKVYITDYIPNPDIEKEILNEVLSEDLHNRIEVLLVWHECIDKKYIDQFPKLKGIVRYGVGYDNVDIAYAQSKGIVFCNTPDYGTEEVSDTAIAMIMNITRGLTRYDYLCRNYTGNTWQENTIHKIKRTSNTVLGVIGAGRIGGSIITRANALRMQTVFYDPYKDRGYEKMLGSKRVDDIETLLKLSDIVSINTPLTDETEHMVDERFVAMMKKGSSFINTARGKIVKNIDVFYDPLRCNFLDCLNLDVLPVEPPGESKLLTAWKNREKWLDGRFIINPHVAYFSVEAYAEMRRKAAENAKRILDGKKPFNIVSV